MPETHPELGHFETSVCGLNKIHWDRVWFIGNMIRAPKPVIAAAELPIPEVANTSLKCEAAPEENYPEHGVIIGWDDEKDKRLSVCQDLAAAVTSVRTP